MAKGLLAKLGLGVAMAAGVSGCGMGSVMFPNGDPNAVRALDQIGQNAWNEHVAVGAANARNRGQFNNNQNADVERYNPQNPFNSMGPATLIHWVDLNGDGETDYGKFDYWSGFFQVDNDYFLDSNVIVGLRSFEFAGRTARCVITDPDGNRVGSWEKYIQPSDSPNASLFPAWNFKIAVIKSESAKQNYIPKNGVWRISLYRSGQENSVYEKSINISFDREFRK